VEPSSELGARSDIGGAHSLHRRWEATTRANRRQIAAFGRSKEDDAQVKRVSAWRVELGEILAHSVPERDRYNAS